MTTEMVLARGLEFTDDQRAMIRGTFARGASDDEFAVLMEIARARRLNPLFKQIHFVKRWTPNGDVWAVQVAIDGLRAIAERSGLYAGQDEPEFIENPDGTLKCAKVKVYRRDWPRPAVGVAFWNECVQTTRDKQTNKDRANAMWSKMPHVMLAKVAEAFALRKAFPEDMAGLYTHDEMGHPADVIESTAEALQPAPAPRELPAPRGVAPVETPRGSLVPAIADLGVEADRPKDRPAPREPGDESEPVGVASIVLTPASFAARVETITLPQEAVSVWMTFRAQLAEWAAPDREMAWKALCARVEAVGKMTNAKVWLKRAIAEEDAKRVTRSDNGPTDDPPAGGGAPGGAPSNGNAQGTSAPAATGAGSRAQLAAVPEWMGSDAGMRAHLSAKTVPTAIDNSVRVHGRHSAAYRELAAQRLQAVSPADHDDTRPTIDTCRALVSRWSSEGPRPTRATSAKRAVA